jgi:hypothetical protein
MIDTSEALSAGSSSLVPQAIIELAQTKLPADVSDVFPDHTHTRQSALRSRLSQTIGSSR